MARGKKITRSDNTFMWSTAPQSIAQTDATYDSAAIRRRCGTPYDSEESRSCSPRSCSPAPSYPLEAGDWDAPEPPGVAYDSLATSEGSPHTWKSESTTMSPSNPDQQLRQLTCSDRFWFEDGSVVLRVKDTIYNVHKSLLKSQSEFFRIKLSMSFSFATTLGSRQDPHILYVGKSEFDLLLTFIYPLECGSKLDYTTQEWLAILNVSTKLKFTSIRTAAINTLSEIVGIAERIRLGREHSVSQWFPECYRQLCTRDEPLSLEEGKELGLEDVIKVARAREMIGKNVPWSELEKSFVE